MSEQIKKYQQQSIQPTSIKIAFQANIFKYIQKRKQSTNLFKGLHDKQVSRERVKNLENRSNLIKKRHLHKELQIKVKQNVSIPIPNEQPTYLQDSLSNHKIILQKREQSKRELVLNRRAKGYKSCLSDWRELYQQRDTIKEKHRKLSNFQGKMHVTDRLFYPTTNLHHQTHQPSQLNPIHTNKSFFNTISDFRIKNHQHFVSDQNFLHMYHRSNSPILIGHAQKKRFIKYLNNNKDRKITKTGIKLMNEGILTDNICNDINFVPYQSLYNPLQTEKALKKQKKIQRLTFYPNNSDKIQLQGNNPQVQRIKSRKNININNQKLSQFFSQILMDKISNENGKNVHLKQFKSRKNKIQNGITSTKGKSSQIKSINMNFVNRSKNDRIFSVWTQKNQ